MLKTRLTGGVQVFLRHSKRAVFVAEVAEGEEHSSSDEGLLHVTDVHAIEEGACRLLDRLARRAFVSQPYKPGVHVLQAPAGSGKTQCNINLAKHLADAGHTPLLLTYNRSARADGAKRTVDDPRLTWKTIDSLVSLVVGEEERSTPESDLQRTRTIVALVQQLLPEVSLAPAAAAAIRAELEAAVIAGTPPASSIALQLYQAGLEGKWWSYAMLRVRALHMAEAWEETLQAYDVVIVDEAQDMGKTMIALVRLLHSTKMVVYTRDKAQQIYGFMGCEDIVEHLQDTEFKAWNLYTTFRHGPAVCSFVNEQGLPVLPTYAADKAPVTRIERMPSSWQMQGPHTLLLCTWVDILQQADDLLNAGRTVALDGEKRTELLRRATAADAEDSLFRRLNPAFVQDVVLRTAVAGSAATANTDCIFITTVFSFKGCEAEVVRLGPCLLKHPSRQLRYVGFTRATKTLVLPDAKRVDASSTASSKKRGRSGDAAQADSSNAKRTRAD